MTEVPWMPMRSARGLPDGVEARGSTGQLWISKGGVWTRPVGLDPTDDQIKDITERFLRWRLPDDFSPDGGIQFTRVYNAEYNAKHGRPPSKHEPTGTNLFSYTQAEAMIRHILASPVEPLELDPETI